MLFRHSMSIAHQPDTHLQYNCAIWDTNMPQGEGGIIVHQHYVIKKWFHLLLSLRMTLTSVHQLVTLIFRGESWGLVWPHITLKMCTEPIICSSFKNRLNITFITLIDYLTAFTGSVCTDLKYILIAEMCIVPSYLCHRTCLLTQIILLSIYLAVSFVLVD